LKIKRLWLNEAVIKVLRPAAPSEKDAPQETIFPVAVAGP
jgi:hypothetical protein